MTKMNVNFPQTIWNPNFTEKIMPSIEMTIGNPYVTKNLRDNRRPTVFHRAMYRLTEEKKNPGKIIPIFCVIENDFKIFGALTINTGGSVSFFPDFFNQNHFDHLTLNANFIEKKGHLTKVENDGKRRKPIHLIADELQTGNYHLITFIMDNGDLLMDSPPEIELAPVTYDNDDEKNRFNEWINELVTAGHCIIDFPSDPGAYCIQIQVVSKSKPSLSYAIESSVIEKFLLSSVSLRDVVFNTRKIDIPTSDKTDFSICIVAFKAPYEMESTFGFFIAQNPEKPFAI